MQPAPPRRPPTTRSGWHWRLAGCLLFTLALSRPGRAADPLPYQVTIDTTDNAALDQALSDASSLVSLRTTAPVGPFALVSRARQDQGRLLTVLQSFGYYDASAVPSIAGHGLDDPDLPSLLDQAPANPPVAVQIRITLGPLFHLRQLELRGIVPPGLSDHLAPLRTGAPAVAEDVVAVRQRLLEALRQTSHPLATVSEPEAIEHPDDKVLDVDWRIDPGPRADLGPISFAGLQRVNEAYVRRRLLLHPGEPYSPATLDAAQRDLTATGLFSAVRITQPAALDEARTLPLTVDLTERPRHVVSATALYSTDLGGSIGGSWKDRDVFGNGESLELKAAITQIGGTATKGLGYDAGPIYTIPDWLQRDQTLVLNLEAVREDLPAYSRTAALGGATVTRKLTPHWTASVGLGAVEEQITQEGATTEYTLLSVPLSVRYDTTNSLLDPTQGVRASVGVTPTESLGHRDTSFAIVDVQGSTYLDFGDALGWEAPGRSVLAVRGVVGSVPGITALQLPPDQRFYGGGSATVRGYRYQSLGPRFADNNPEGGTALAAASVEWRQRVLSSYGFAAFVDAGQVSNDSSGAPFSGPMQIGAGVGARYYTAFGPIRADIAVPLNKRPGDDTFELYIGLGQAF